MRSVSAISVLTATGMLLSLAAQVAIAAMFGSKGNVDAYFGAATLPGAVAAILSGATGPALIRVVAGVRNSEGDAAAWSEISLAMSTCVYVAGGCAVIAIILAGPLVYVALPGFSPSQHVAASTLTRLLWPVAALTWCSSLLAAVHHLNFRFVLPAAASLAVPVGMLLVGWAFRPTLGIAGLAVGQLAGAALQFLMLAGLWLQNGRFTLKPRLTQPLKELARVAAPLLIAGHLHLLLPVIDRYLASRLAEGSISYLGYSQRIATMISALTGYAVAATLFPKWTSLIARGHADQVSRSLTSALRILALVVLPLVVFIGIFSDAIVRVVFEHGAFNADATAGVAAALRWYLVAAVWMAAGELIARAYFAAGRTVAFAVTGLLCLLLYVATSVVCARYFGFKGLAAAAAIYWTFFTVALAAGLAESPARVGWADVAKTSLGSLTLSLVAAYGGRAVALSHGASVGPLWLLFALVFGASAYGVVGILVWRPAKLRELARTAFRFEETHNRGKLDSQVSPPHHT